MKVTLGSAQGTLQENESALSSFNGGSFLHGGGLHSNFVWAGNPGPANNAGDGGGADGGGWFEYGGWNDPFAPVNGGGPPIGGCDPVWGCPNGPVLGIHYPDPASGGSGSGNTGGSGTPTTSPVSLGSGGSSSCSLWNPLTWVGDCLLRALLLIIGLLCIAGAIYLYKPTSEIIGAPVRAAKDVASGAVAKAAAAAA